MKCKSCGSELIAGTKKCPYCGAVINIVRKRAEEVFDWSTVSPQSKKKKDVSIDWNTGKIFDKSSGQVYNQNNHRWSEPEDVKDLFKFDRKNEEYQQVLDRQVDSITETAAGSAPETQERADDVKRKFDLPSSMGMVKFDSLIKNADVQFVSESGEEVGSIGRPETKAEPEVRSNAENAAAPAVQKVRQESAEPERNISTETGFTFKKADIERDKKESPSPAQQPAVQVKTENDKDTYTPEEEDRVFSSLKKLMAAEEKFKSDMERASFITPEESAQAAKVEEKCSKLTFVPTVSFRTIEDEYAEYCDEHGIEHKKPKASAKQDENRSETADAEAEKPDAPAEKNSAKEHETKHRKHSLRESIREGLKSIERNQDKAVEIKINEPSGTKVTVKTQEVSLAAAEREMENAQTREVNMDEVVKPAKNLQVSVEVNAAQGNASVEVTRRHDGATVVKTVDKGNHEHLYVDDEDKTETIQGTSDDNSDGTDGDTSFWERPDGVKKMTITDIFGPEARKILNQIDKNHSEEEKRADEDIENSLILDINPEDIAMTEDQTAALYTIAGEIDEEEDADTEEVDAEPVETAEDTGSDEPEAIEIEASEEKISDNDTAAGGSAEDSNEKDSDKDEGALETQAVKPDETGEISVSPETEKENEIVEDEDKNGIYITPSEASEENETQETDGETAAETAAESMPADVKSEPEKTEKPAENRAVNVWASDPVEKRAPSAPKSKEESSIINAPDLEKTRPIMKAEKAIMKEAARQKKRAEKAQKKLLKENKTTKKDDKKPSGSSENKGFSKVLKLFTAILVIILIIEFSIIGIKLFASDSQAAVFIDKVEQYAAGIIKGGDSSSNSGNEDQQTPSQPDDSTGDASQGQDTAGDDSGTTEPADGAA